MTLPNKSELYEKSLLKQLKLLEHSTNVLVISSHVDIQKNLDGANISKDNVFVLKHNSDYKLHVLDENNIDSLNLEKFQFIILDDVLEYLINPKSFLIHISKFLESDGVIVGSISNFTNIINKIHVLDGDFNNVLLDIEKKFHHYSLDNFLLLLSDSNFSITHLTRIKIDITNSNQTNLKNYIIPTEIFDAITNDPESSTSTYVFSIKPDSIIKSSIRRWILEFSKNQVMEKMDSILNDIRIIYEKKIDYHVQTNREQYAIVKHLEQGIAETTEHYEKIIKQIIKDKDTYIEQIIKDKDTYIEQIIKDKDIQLQEIKQSIVFKLLRILDKLKGKNV